MKDIPVHVVMIFKKLHVFVADFHRFGIFVKIEEKFNILQQRFRKQ